MMAPTVRLRRFLSRHCSTATMERLVDPILTDVRFEAARAEGWTSLWIHFLGVAVLVKALALHGSIQFISIREWPVDDRRVLARTLVYAAGIIAAAIPLLMLPFLVRFPAARAQELAPYLVPQALPIALPLGLFIGLIYGFRARVMSVRPRMALMIAAILCSMASFAALAWLVPVSNQAFRVAASSDPFIPKGLPELSLGELRSRIDDNQRAASTYHSRWALSATPLVLTAWAFLLIGRLPHGGRWLPGIVAIASCVAYALLMDTGRRAGVFETLPPIAGAWLPNAVFVAAILLLTRRTSNEHEPTRTTNGALSA
jgi:hypothetical protein